MPTGLLAKERAKNSARPTSRLNDEASAASPAPAAGLDFLKLNKSLSLLLPTLVPSRNLTVPPLVRMIPGELRGRQLKL